MKNNLPEKNNIQQLKDKIDALTKTVSMLKKSEQLLANAINDAPIGMVTLTIKGNFKTVNKAFRKITGYTEKELLTMNISQITHPDDKHIWYDVIEELTAGKANNASFEKRYIHKNGYTIYVQVSTVILRDELGAPQKFFTQMVDVTKQWQAEREIHQRTEDLMLINTINMTINQGGDLHEILQFFAQETRRIYKCKSATIYIISKDKKYLEMQHLSAMPAMTKQIEKLIGTRIPKIQIPIKEGSLFHKLLRANEPYLMNDPQVIQNWMLEFTETTFLPDKMRPVIRKLIPQIYKILRIKSVITVPLISEGESIGLLDIAHPELFTEEDTKRIVSVAGQMTTVIKRLWANVDLKESENKLWTLFDTANDGIFIIDKESKRILSINPKVTDYLGYPKDELVGKPINKLYCKKDLPIIGKHIEQLMKEGRVIFEAQQIRKDGSLIDVEVSNKVFSYGGKEVFHSIVRDITKRKQSEKEKEEFITELMNREEKFRTLTQNLNIGVYRSTPGKNGIFIEANSAFLKMFEFRSKDELERWKTVDFYPDSEERKSVEEELAAKGFLINKEIMLRKKDGTIFIASMSTTTAKDESGKVTHYDGIIEDVTERKKAEVQLKESHDSYATIFNGAIDGIIYSNWSGKILAVNLTFTNLTGIKKADLVGKNGIQLIKELAPKKFTVETLDFIKKVLRGDAVNGFPIEYNNRVLEYYTPEQKGRRGITIMVRDVTERSKANKKIKLHKKYQEALSNELAMSQEKTKRRLAIVLHDKLGQSLVLAKFKADELNKKTADSENKKIIDEITSNIEEAINESRNITYELSPAVLYEMGLISAISLKLDDIEKANKIKTSLIDQSNSYELEEKVQIILFRTISELLQNVIMHSKAENVNVSFRRTKGSYRITVSDNGIGFDLEAMRDEAVSQKKFGLFSIMERIRYIGGEVNIDAVPKKGTKVIVNIPIKK